MVALLRRLLLLCLLALSSLPSSAAFHLWIIDEVFSNADGKVQYIELRALTGGQQFLAGHSITAGTGPLARTYTFPSDLPGDTTESASSLAPPVSRHWAWSHPTTSCPTTSSTSLRAP